MVPVRVTRLIGRASLSLFRECLVQSKRPSIAGRLEESIRGLGRALTIAGRIFIDLLRAGVPRLIQA